MLHLNEAAVVVVGRFTCVAFFVTIRHAARTILLRLDLRIRQSATIIVVIVVVSGFVLGVVGFSQIGLRV
jgi:hypothetical protein